MATKKRTKGKTKETTRTDVSASGRTALLAVLRKAGLKVEEKRAWHKVIGKEKRHVYVAAKGPQVHLSRFTIRGAFHLDRLSDKEAKRRHLGSVRAILHLDRNNEAAIKAAARAIVSEMR